MTNEQRAAARSLAVAYHAFLEASREFHSENSEQNAEAAHAAACCVRVWGPMLLEAQDATGVVLLEPPLVSSILASATARPAEPTAADAEDLFAA